MTNVPLTLPFPPPADAAPVLVAHGPAARERLFAAIRDLQADDPLAPVTVAVPSPYAGLSLRRDLGVGGGLLNVRFMALSRVAELLGAPALAAAGRRPLAPALRVEAVAAALAADPGPFAEVLDHPSTARGLASSLADLRAGGIAPERAAAELGGRGPRAATVARLYADVTARTSSYYDEDDVLRAATAVVEHGADDDLGHLIVWLPAHLSPAEAAFVGALATAGRATVLLGLTGDDDVDRPLARDVARRLGLDAAAESPALPVGSSVLTASDPEDEVRAVVRRIVERADASAPLHELAVLYRLEEPYARLVPELLDAAGIAWNGPSPRRLADAVVARVLLGVLALADTDLARDELAAWLASGPVLDPNEGRRVPATRWDVVSREAGVVGGAQQWADRLRRHLGQLADELAAARAEADVSEWHVARLEGDLETTERLARFVADLVEALAPPAERTWAAHVDWASTLVDGYLGGVGRRGDWPDGEIEAARRVEAALESLTALDELGTTVELGRFRRALAEELDVPFGRVERFGAGVYVGALHHAYGTRFDTVFVLGMVEGAFPPRGREDPLLPDAERRAVGEGLPSYTERRLAERRDYLAALAAAPERILCFPRGDPRSQRRRLPARWLLETARPLHGAALTAEQLRDLEARPWLDVVDSFEGGVKRDAEPGSLTERDVRALAEWDAAHFRITDHPLATGTLGDGFRAIAERSSSALTAYDGLVAGAGLAPDATRPIAPTSLQDWAACPFQYLLSRVLRVREVVKPEVTETISALDEGTLVHTILERFVATARPRSSPDEGWDAADAELLAKIVDEECVDAERRGVTGRPLAWKLARRRVRQTAERFLRADTRVRAVMGTLPVPDGLELAFGIDGKPPATLALPHGRAVAFRGRIDRVDRSPEGDRLAVYDYKTGRPAEIPDDPVDGGHMLQLPVYALAASAHYGVANVSASYWYTQLEDERALAGLPLDATTHDRFADVVGHIVDGIDAGCFPANPGDTDWNHRERRETFSNCKYCPYDRLCAPDRRAAWDRKASDAALAPFHALVGMGL
jgi:RecB family exonuclease